MTDELILVDTYDNQIGVGEKLKIHQKGLLHRCFSIIVINRKLEILLQKRADEKYHSPGLWTNTCCGHPFNGEDTLAAAKRRLREEMGFNCSLMELGSFLYRAEFKNRLIEHEFDHVFGGVFSGNPDPDPAEVKDHKWVDLEFLNHDMKKNPGIYTVWLPLILENMYQLRPDWIRMIF